MKIPRKTFEANVPSMAMGDIAFLLLIFFIILAKAVDDSHVVWTPAEIPDPEAVGSPLASVAIDVDEATHLNGEEIDPASLSAALKEILSDTPPGKRTVFLKVHHEAKAGSFQPAIEAISVAGGDLVHIVEQHQAEEGQ